MSLGFFYSFVLLDCFVYSIVFYSFVLAAILEGKFISKDELIYYSTIPNLQAAQSGLVQTLNSVGGQIVNQLNSHQNNLVSQLQERIKQLEEVK